MEVKCLEVRDDGTFMPVICLRPTPDNEGQRYLLRRDGYSGGPDERCIIFIKPQCGGVAYDCYDWDELPRTTRIAHNYIAEHWNELVDGSVIDVEYILGERATIKQSECFTVLV